MGQKQPVNESVEWWNAFATWGGHNFFSWALVSVLLVLLGIAACKNISYPLLWNDEAETAMTAQQIIKYGYPKVHDGKNTVFVPDNPLWLGYKAQYDVLITIPWGNFYFGAIGVKLAQFSNDIYQKTALIRLPFVIAALLGLMIFAFSMRGFFASAASYRVFFAAFLFFEMLSVNLLVHIREARYYAQIVLTTACFFYVFTAFHFHKKYSRSKYLILLTLILVVAFNVSYITYVSLFATAGLYQCFAYLGYRKRKSGFVPASNFKESLVLISPLIISAIFISPELVFFQFFENSKLAGQYYQSTILIYFEQLGELLFIMCRFDVMAAMVTVKLCRVWYAYRLEKNNLAVGERTKKLQGMAFFMLLFFIALALLAAKMPFIFTRYFIVLQPVVVLMLLTDIVIILDCEALLPAKKFWKSFLPMACLICLLDIAVSDNHIADYVHQLTHRLKGPLDYYIPALREKYQHPENIVVATNYEEFAYEYYLQCKVIVGYQNLFKPVDENELKQYSPDAIIIRPNWKQDMKPYQYYLQHATYQKVFFPVKDWQVNDLSDLFFRPKHQFKTQVAEADSERAYMYLKD